MSNAISLAVVDGPEDDLLPTLRFSSAATQLRTAAGAGDPRSFAHELRRGLRTRFGRKGGDPKRLAERFPLAERSANEVYSRLIDGSDRSAEKTEKIVEPAARPVSIVAQLDGLRRFGGTMDPASLWLAWRAAWVDSTRLMDRAPTEETPLERILASEAVFASGIFFDGLADARGRRKAARQRIAAELDEHTDTDGSPHADLLPFLPAWFASLVRCATWAKVGKASLWNAKSASRYDDLVRAVATMTGPDGRIALSANVDVRPLLAEALKRSSWKAAEPVARLVSQLQKAGNKSDFCDESRPRKLDKTSPPVLQSDWGKLVAARSRWIPHADLLAVAHQVAIPSIEFRAFGRSILSGEWGLRVLIDGDEVTLKPDCDSVSWFSDADADYLELQWPAEQGVVLCRQALLTRGDHQLVLADCVSTPSRPESRIEVTATLPLRPGINAEPKRPLRELRLDAQGLPLRCFPASLPMDRTQNADGSLECVTGEIALRQSGVGGVYAATVFDWHPRRRDVLADWRNLTVTQDSRRLSQAEAAGVRLRLGKRQLLLYRGLDGSKSARAVLGYHHAFESVIGRFNSDGEVEPLVLVE